MKGGLHRWVLLEYNAVVDAVVIIGAIIIVVIVVSANRRKNRTTRDNRDTLLHSLAPVVSGTVSDQQALTGAYDGHAVTATLRRTGRIDNATIESGTDVNNFEVIELELRGAPGRSPWGRTPPPAAASTAPATSPASGRTARSSSWAGWTPSSRSAASGWSPGRWKPPSPPTPRSPRLR